MSSERRVEVELEMPATPEQAWEAIATGRGITAWFMPAEVDGRVGGSVVHRHDAETATTGTVTAYDPPQRFAYEEAGWQPEEPTHVTATEFLVEARAGGTCVVRIVMSGFGDDEAWERAMESYTSGWSQALHALRLYLTHFPGERAASVTAGGMAEGRPGEVWSQLTDALGLPSTARVGERIATSAEGAPALAGTVANADERMLTLVVDEPARGLAFIGAGGPGDQVYVFVRAQLFGPDAAQIAEREQGSWTAWFSGATRPRTAR